VRCVLSGRRKLLTLRPAPFLLRDGVFVFPAACRELARDTLFASMKNLSLSTLAVATMLLASATPALAKPSIGSVSPTNPDVNVSTNMTASVSGASGIKTCNLWIESEDLGEMVVTGNIASMSHTFTRAGVHTAFVFCRENDGTMNSGPNTSIFVQGVISAPSAPLSSGGYTAPTPTITTTSTTPSATSTPATPPVTLSRLVKLVCPADAAADHPCKAVYYVGTDAKRHAFPNGKVYATWYANFDSVEEISASEMSSYGLGKNVNYRPGVRLVKFTTDPKVYAVSKGGVLRWIKTEEVAKALYGEDWAKKVDDLSDVFYMNYSFGSEIIVTSDYSAIDEMNQATNIGASW
jgi:hypothetical protein